MNPVLLASTSAMAETTPEKATVSASAAPASSGTFSLPQSGLNAAAERLIGAKLSHQQTSAAAHKPDDANPAAMQALLAMLLAQPTQAAPADLQKQPDGDMLRMLAQVQTTHSGSSLLRQLASAMAQPEKRPRHLLSSIQLTYRHCRLSYKRYWRHSARICRQQLRINRLSWRRFPPRICVRLRRSLRHSRPPNKFLLG